MSLLAVCGALFIGFAIGNLTNGHPDYAAGCALVAIAYGIFDHKKD